MMQNQKSTDSQGSFIHMGTKTSDADKPNRGKNPEGEPPNMGSAGQRDATRGGQGGSQRKSRDDC